MNAKNQQNQQKQRRTDLAEEGKELWEEGGRGGTLSGVRSREVVKDGLRISHVDILNEEGACAIGKPVGHYVTLTMNESVGDHFQTWVRVLAEEVEKLIKSVDKQGLILVVGLGNASITPDAIGPCVHGQIAVTRHLVAQLPQHFSHIRPVSSVESGVLGTTGLESSEFVRGVVQELKPSCVIAVDALASRSLSRVCRTIQLADTGITPGSGVGNHRGALNRETLGVPVIAVGVPTVVDGGTMVADLLGMEEIADGIEGGDFFVTPKEIDSEVSKLSKLLAYGLNLGLNPCFSLEDLTLLAGDGLL